MKPNIGTNDRIARLIIGVVLISLAVINKSTFMALGGLFSIYEAVSSWCVFYQILGRNTCPIKNPKSAFEWKETLVAGLRILLSAHSPLSTLFLFFHSFFLHKISMHKNYIKLTTR